MTEENKKKNKIIGIGIGILIVLLVVISSTYAYWQITKSQEDVNKMVAACLNLDIKFNGGLTMEDQWPKEKYVAMRDLAGYTFTIENKCEEAVNYVIGLESVKDDKISAYMSHSAIALAMDNGYLGTYNTLGDLEGPTLDALASKELKTATVEGKSTNTHNLKIWIDENAPIDEQGKGFAGRVFITGGQGLLNDNPQITATSESCFEITDDGEITGYDESCGTSVTIPATVNSVAVKTIDTDAFRETTTTYNYDFIAVTDSTGNPQRAYILEPAREQEIVDWANENGFGSVEMHLYTETPSVGDGEMLLYCDITRSLDNLCDRADDSELTTTETKISITGLDLSQALYLEIIEASAFSNVPEDITELSEYVNYNTSLTALNFGDNINEIEFEHNSFARINLDNLTLYSSYYSIATEDRSAMPFASSVVKNLTVEVANEDSDLRLDYLDSVSAMAFPIQGMNVDNIILNNITKYDSSIFASSKIGTLTLPSTINLEESRIGSSIEIDTVIISDGITTIPKGSFSNTKINEMILADSVVTIEESAFYTSKIASITLSNNLETIGRYAFYGTSELKTVEIPKSVTTICEYAFFDYPSSSIKTITMLGRTDLTGMTLEPGWYNSEYSTIVFE